MKHHFAAMKERSNLKDKFSILLFVKKVLYDGDCFNIFSDLLLTAPLLTYPIIQIFSFTLIANIIFWFVFGFQVALLCDALRHYSPNKINAVTFSLWISAAIALYLFFYTSIPVSILSFYSLTVIFVSVCSANSNNDNNKNIFFIIVLAPLYLFIMMMVAFCGIFDPDMASYMMLYIENKYSYGFTMIHCLCEPLFVTQDMKLVFSSDKNKIFTTIFETHAYLLLSLVGIVTAVMILCNYKILAYYFSVLLSLSAPLLLNPLYLKVAGYYVVSAVAVFSLQTLANSLVIIEDARDICNPGIKTNSTIYPLYRSFLRNISLNKSSFLLFFVFTVLLFVLSPLASICTTSFINSLPITNFLLSKNLILLKSFAFFLFARLLFCLGFGAEKLSPLPGSSGAVVPQPAGNNSNVSYCAEPQKITSNCDFEVPKVEGH